MNEKNLVKVITRGLQVDEMGAEVDELTRDRGNSILVHGLPVQQVECSFMSNKLSVHPVQQVHHVHPLQQAECLESLVKLMSDLVRTSQLHSRYYVLGENETWHRPRDGPCQHQPAQTNQVCRNIDNIYMMI